MTQFLIAHLEFTAFYRLNQIKRQIKAPETKLEHALLPIWKEALGIDKIGIDDDYFRLGGDSISALKIIVKLRELNIHLIVNDIFTYTTIHSLANYATSKNISAKKNKSVNDKNFRYSLPKFVAANHNTTEIEDYYPLSPLQNGLLFHHIYSPKSEAYMVHFVWKNASGDIDVVILQEAWYILVNRHPILRTYFAWQDLEKPIQIVLSKLETPWKIYHWTDIQDEKIHEARLMAFLKADREAGFDLNSAPLFRLTLIHLPGNQHYFFVTFHHILLDGWSLSILINELNQIYQAKKLNKNSKLPPITPYKYFINWHQGKNLSKAKSYWKKYLKNYSVNDNLSALYKENINQNSASDIRTVSSTISQSVTKEIKSFCHFEKLTLNTLFQGVWSLLLNQYSQNDDIIVGVTLTERTPDIKNSDQIIGLLINTLPFRFQFKKNIPIRLYLKEIQNNFLKIMDRHYSPLSELHQWGNIASTVPLFNNIFVFENYPKNQTSKDLIKFSEAQVFDPTHYPLACIIVPDNKLIIKLAYDHSKFDDKTIENMLNNFQVLLTKIANNPETLIFNMDLLTPQEYQQISKAWLSHELDINNKTIHGLFEEQAEKAPNKVAVEFHGQKITYGELNSR